MLSGATDSTTSTSTMTAQPTSESASPMIAPHSAFTYLTVGAELLTKNSIAVGKSNSGLSYAYALKSGTQFGSSKFPPQWANRAIMAFVFASSCHCDRGYWFDVKNRYLGLELFINGKPHYGWARLSVTGTFGSIKATLTGYAYETIPGKPIIAGKTHGGDDAEYPGPGASLTNPVPAPQPATLGALATGAPGLSIWRRKEAAGQGN